MIVLKNSVELKSAIRYHHHESSKIGKLDINYDKMLANNKYLHLGHIECINRLRNAGCNIIILECINANRCFNSIKTNIPESKYFHDDNPILENLDLISYCKNILKIDYLLYNANDYLPVMPTELVHCVDTIIREENYVDLLKLSKNSIKLLRANLIIRTYRSLKNLTYIKSHKDGNWVFALKHYLEKYLHNNLIIIDPIYDINSYPLSSSINNIVSDVYLFTKYFYNINKLHFKDLDKVLDNLIHYCRKINGELTTFKFVKLKLTEYKLFVCVFYKDSSSEIHKFTRLI